MGDLGRPTDYKKEYIDQGYRLCLLGYTDLQLAEFWGVCEATINNWKNNHPEFLESLKKGKDLADADIAESLYMRAKGYSHKEDKILSNSQDPQKPIIVETVKRYPPDTTACAIWLNNRQSIRWKSRRPVENVDDDAEEVDSLEYKVVDASNSDTK